MPTTPNPDDLAGILDRPGPKKRGRKSMGLVRLQVLVTEKQAERLKTIKNVSSFLRELINESPKQP